MCRCSGRANRRWRAYKDWLYQTRLRSVHCSSKRYGIDWEDDSRSERRQCLGLFDQGKVSRACWIARRRGVGGCRVFPVRAVVPLDWLPPLWEVSRCDVGLERLESFWAHCIRPD